MVAAGQRREDELAHENLSRGLDAIEDAAGVTPRGFIAPRQEVNAATLRAVEELDMAWVLGRTGAEVPSGIDFLEPAHPYDLILLNEGADPPEAFDRIREQTRPGAALLFHPNMLEYYDRSRSSRRGSPTQHRSRSGRCSGTTGVAWG